MQRIDIENKLFEVKSSNDQKVYSRDLIKIPRCECMDWRRYKLPCKHMSYVFKYVPGIDWDCLPVAYLQQDFLKVDDQLLERALADSACPEDVTLDDKETENCGENDTGVDVNIEQNVDNVNNDIDEFENYGTLKMSKSNSVKILRRKCISSVETLKNKIHECNDRAMLRETLDTLTDMVERVNKTLPKDPSQRILLTSCQLQALVQQRKGTTARRKDDNIRPLKNNKSRKRKLENWKSQVKQLTNFANQKSSNYPVMK